MALSDREVSALADMVATLRPEWNARVTRAYLASKWRGRTYEDLAVALAAVAVRSESQTPAVIELDWPWTVAAAARRQGSTPHVGPEPGADRCQVYGHEHETAQWCRLCAADRVAEPDPQPEPEDEDGAICDTEHPQLPDVRCVVTTPGHRKHRGVNGRGHRREIVSWRDPLPEPEPEPEPDAVETPEEVSAP